MIEIAELGIINSIFDYINSFLDKKSTDDITQPELIFNNLSLILS